MKKILFAIALAVVATACHTENEGDVQFGKIAINTTTRAEVGDNDSTADKFVLGDYLLPNAKELKVEITGNGTTQTWESLDSFERAIEEGLTFASTLHTITMSHGTKGVEGWSKPYFEGSTSVEVPMYGLSVDADITVVLANSIVEIETSKQFNGYFPTSKFQINGIDWDLSKRDMLFLNAGEATITCEATRQTGKVTTLESKIELKPTTRHKVVFELSTVGNAKVNVVFDNEIVETIELEFELNENA